MPTPFANAKLVKPDHSNKTTKPHISYAFLAIGLRAEMLSFCQLNREGVVDKGLIIGGRRIEGSDADFDGILKPVLAPGADATGREAILAAADPLDAQIVDAMIKDHVLHDWPDLDALSNNMRLRRAVIEQMRQISSGVIDANYAFPAQGIIAVLGRCNNAAWYNQRAKNANPEKRDRLHREMYEYWNNLGDGSFAFEATDKPLADCVENTMPFRGECQGAMQLSILRGARLALGDARLNEIGRKIGVPAFVGTSHVPPGRLPRETKAHGYTLANRFLDYHPVPHDYSRGSRLGVPGDYFYYKNIDIYTAFSFGQGGWQGENAIYMGDDFLNTPHYSGMGLANNIELELNFEMANAVYHDCNQPYIEAMRTGKTPLWPFILVEKPEDLRFTLRGILREPELSDNAVPDLRPMPEPEPLQAPEDIEARLAGLGATPDARGLWHHTALSFADVEATLGIGAAHLRETPSGPMYGSSYAVSLGHWLIVLQPVSPEANPGHPDTQVQLQALKKPLGF